MGREFVEALNDEHVQRKYWEILNALSQGELELASRLAVGYDQSMWQLLLDKGYHIAAANWYDAWVDAVGESKRQWEALWLDLEHLPAADQPAGEAPAPRRDVEAPVLIIGYADYMETMRRRYSWGCIWPKWASGDMERLPARSYIPEARRR